LRLAVVPVTDALVPDMPTATVVATLQAWTTLVGAISLELFGHWRNTVHDPERFFEQTLGALASSVGLR
jgi:hypothetical protein